MTLTVLNKRTCPALTTGHANLPTTGYAAPACGEPNVALVGHQDANLPTSAHPCASRDPAFTAPAFGVEKTGFPRARE